MDCSPPVSSIYGISQAKYWSGLPFPIPEYFPNLGIEPHVSCISCIGRGFFTTEPLAAAAAKSPQWCPTLRDPIGGSPPGSAIPGILQARTLEWVAISFSNKWKWSHSVVSDSSRPHGLQPTRLLCPWDFPGKSTGVGGHCLLELSHLGSP